MKSLVSSKASPAEESLMHYNQGNMHLMQGKIDAAIASYRRALALKPDFAEVHSNLGNAFLAQGKEGMAIKSYERAIQLKPDHAETYNNLGNLLRKQNKLDAAIMNYRQAIALKLDYAEAHSNLGAALRKQGKLNEAIESCSYACRLKPDHAIAHYNLGNALQEQGKLDAAIESLRHALALRPDFSEAHSNLLFALSMDPGCTPAQYLAEAVRYGSKALARATPCTHWSVSDVSDGKHPLRVGLVSGDLRTHPVGHFLESILAHLNPARLQLVAYSTNPIEDALTARIKRRFSAWNTISGVSDDTVAKKILKDGIHILIDLSGHTAGNRLPIFAWKPAPVQVSWLGYFASTGVPGMDYLLADPVSVPEAHRAHFSEKVWHLPDTRLCFTPPTKADDFLPAPLPALRNGHVTFGCFQNLAKINDSVLSVWGRIFHALPHVRLRVQNKQMGNATERAHLQQRLQKAGIGADRVTMHSAVDRLAYLAAHAEVDIILDTFPYPGGTTTCEALWMGVPTLTLAGDRMLARQGASLIACAGLPEWIAQDEEDYLARALAHAKSIDRLAELRSILRRKVLASPLFDAKRFASHLEDALHGMWQLKKT